MVSIATSLAYLNNSSSAKCNVSQTDNASDWFMDTRASAHMTPSINNLENALSYSGNGRVIVSNSEALPISHFGAHTLFDYVKLLKVLVVPSLTKSLVLIRKFTQNYPVYVLFTDTSFQTKTWDTRLH